MAAWGETIPDYEMGQTVEAKIPQNVQMVKLQEVCDGLIAPKKIDPTVPVDMREYIERKFPTDQQLEVLRTLLPKESWSERFRKKCGL
jgi:hypothetical protein